MLDVNIIQYDEQDLDKLAKLRLALDTKYEYLENELFDKGFKNAIKRFLRGERNRLKARFSQGLTMCPMNIQLKQWERLKEYWSILLVEKKIRQMSKAWKKVVNVSHMGRTRKARKEAQLVSSALFGSMLISFMLD